MLLVSRNLRLRQLLLLLLLLLLVRLLLLRGHVLGLIACGDRPPLVLRILRPGPIRLAARRRLGYRGRNARLNETKDNFK